MRTAFSQDASDRDTPEADGSGGEQPRPEDELDEATRLIDAAFRVMERHGFEATTVEAILTESGLARRAFYRHVDSKDALLLAMYRREAERAGRRLRERSGEGDARTRLRAWIEETVSFVGDARRAARTLLLQAQATRIDPERTGIVGEITALVVDPLRDILTDGRADGSFPDADPERDAAAIHAVLWAEVERQLRGGSLEPAQVVEHVCRFCLPALGRKGRR